MRHRHLATTILSVAGLLAIGGCGAAPSATTSTVASRHAPLTRVAAAAAEARATVPGYGKVKHVFVIVLENESYTSTYLHNPNPYLGKTLQKQGRLLTNYYAIGHYSNDNYIAMISGQAPNSATSADCSSYSNFNHTTANATINKAGQAVGTGCVYPKNVMTLANQLSTAHIKWHGYMQSMGNIAGREQKRCGVPTVFEGFDQTEIAKPGDQYAARHNPFVYFHSLVDTGLCHKHVVPLTQLSHDLKNGGNAPSFNFITPDLCDDGHDSPCAGVDVTGSSAGGLTSVDHFLKVWIPKIKKSPEYRNGGLIIITSDEAATTDASSCCHEKPGPSDDKPGLKGPGGGRIGTLLIGKCVKPDSTDAKHYNHYSLLRSLENLYGIRKGGTDGKGHLGYAAAKGLRPFGNDVFDRCKT